MTILSHEEIMELEGEKWKPMSREEVEAAIEVEPCNSHIEKYSSCKEYYEWELDKDRFLSIIWLNINETGPLTPDGEPRTIQDVAERMVSKGYTFEKLIEKHRLTWYKKCRKIESEGFDYAKFGTIWIKGATEDERKESRPGKYHIEHGAHRSLVLGKLLREEKIEYQLIRAILIKTTGSKDPDEICY